MRISTNAPLKLRPPRGLGSMTEMPAAAIHAVVSTDHVVRSLARTVHVWVHEWPPAAASVEMSLDDLPLEQWSAALPLPPGSVLRMRAADPVTVLLCCDDAYSVSSCDGTSWDGTSCGGTRYIS